MGLISFLIIGDIEHLSMCLLDIKKNTSLPCIHPQDATQRNVPYNEAWEMKEAQQRREVMGSSRIDKPRWQPGMENIS